LLEFAAQAPLKAPMRRFDASTRDFAAAFAAFLDEPRGPQADVERAVAEVVDAVRREGADALLRYSKQFDGGDPTVESLAVTEAEIAAGVAACAPDLLEAIAFAARRIGAYHERLLPTGGAFTDAEGVELAWRWTALDAVGIYVPGGRAAYPSTVLMNAVPARIAGVKRIAMVTPPGGVKPAVLAAAREAGVTEIWRVGGAQAVAALAYGAGPIAPVDKIVGPGNAYVTEAKRRVYGKVGIDALAGPSEVVVVADGANDPAWIAADLLAQAEHDPDAQSILITDDAAFATAVEAAIRAELVTLSTARDASASWRDHGAIVLCSMDQAPALVDQIAPEHVELAVTAPAAMAAKVRHAGAMFLGRHTPEAIGDYVAGSNHVLPTSRAARFSSGLSTADFQKRTSILNCSPDALAALAPAALTLSAAEGLTAHGLSISVRSNRRG
jgi:histidinol dehydrogenase